MTLSEESRHALHLRLDELLGRSEAATLMELLPPVGWADVATKRDLDALEARVTGEMKALEGRLHLQLATWSRAVVYANIAAVFTTASLAFAAARM